MRTGVSRSSSVTATKRSSACGKASVSQRTRASLGASSRQAPCTDKLQIGTKDEELFPPVVRQLEGLLVYGVSRRRRLASIEIERSLLSPEARLLSKAWIKGASRTPLPERQQIGITFKTFTNSQDNIHFPYQMQLLGEAVMDLAEDEFVKYSSLFHDTQVAARPTVGPQLWQKYQKKHRHKEKKERKNMARTNAVQCDNPCANAAES